MSIFEIRIQGHLTASKLAAELTRIDDADQQNPCGLLFDALEMTKYDRDARALFVEFNQRQRHRLCAVAIVTRNPLWRMVVSAMAFASGQTMQPFEDASEGRAWLESLGAHRATA